MNLRYTASNSTFLQSDNVRIVSILVKPTELFEVARGRRHIVRSFRHWTLPANTLSNL